MKIVLALSILVLVVFGCKVGYQGATTNLGAFQKTSTFTQPNARFVSLSKNGNLLVLTGWSNDKGFRNIYKKSGLNYPLIFPTSNSNSSGVAGESFFSPLINNNEKEVVHSYEETIQILKEYNGTWMTSPLLPSNFPTPNYPYSNVIMNGLGNTLAVESFTIKNSNPSSQQAASMWFLNNGSWTKTDEIPLPSNAFPNSQFVPLSMDELGNQVVMHSGSKIYIFKRNGTSWQDQVPLANNLNNLNFEQQAFMSSNGNKMALMENGNRKTHILEKNNNIFVNTHEIDGILMGMSTDGRTVVVQNYVSTGTDGIGTPQSQGFLEVYQLQNNNWTKQATIAPKSDRNSYKRVAISHNGNTIAVLFQDPPFQSTSRVEIYTK